jgi:hypothetical protein
MISVRAWNWAHVHTVFTQNNIINNRLKSGICLEEYPAFSAVMKPERSLQGLPKPVNAFSLNTAQPSSHFGIYIQKIRFNIIL